MNITLDIRPSLDNVSRRFKNIDFQKALQNEINTVALIIEGQSKKRSPVLTGRMRGSIFTTLGHLTARIMPTVNYAIFVHEGTRYMKARPYMLWGVQDSKGEIQRVLGKEVKIQIVRGLK